MLGRSGSGNSHSVRELARRIAASGETASATCHKLPQKNVLNGFARLSPGLPTRIAAILATRGLKIMKCAGMVEIRFRFG